VEPAELGLAPDHRRIQPARERGCARDDSQQPPSVDRLRAAFQLQRVERLDEGCIANEPVGRLAEQNLTWARRRLEPLRERHGFTGCEGVPFGWIACHDLSGVDASPHPELEPVLGAQLLVQLRQRLAQLGGGPHRPQGIVLVQDRDPERGHDRVADELLDRSAVVLEDAADLDEVARDDPPVRLCVEPLAERRRVDHVREDDRDRLPHLARRSALPERGSTCEAEPRAGWVGLATAGTGGHVLF
jgi:hypothetical protein